MLDKIAIARTVWKLFAPLPLPWRLHQVLRSLVFPVGELVGCLPAARSAEDPVTLLDLGCGHGIFLALAQSQRPDLALIGFDLSAEKIESARKVFAASGIPVRELAIRDIADFPIQAVDVISIIDVLYLVPLDRWDAVVTRCYQCLRPGRRLLLKEMDPSKRWKYRLLHVEEFLAVKVLGLTLGESFTFPERSVVTACLRRAGLTVIEKPVDRGYHVPHFLWVGTKC